MAALCITSRTQNLMAELFLANIEIIRISSSKLKIKLAIFLK